MKQRIPADLLFSKPEQKEFVDRTEIRGKVIEACNNMENNLDAYFKVIDIYGIGGIGKSRLISELKIELKNRLSADESKLVAVSFEIEGRQQVLRNLIQIRRAFKDSCTVFDYALMTYWDKAGCIEKLDNEFMYQIRANFLAGLTDIIASLGSSIFPDLPNVPSINNIFEYIGILIQKGQQCFLRDQLERISQLEPQELIEKMPQYLGFDIGRLTGKTPCALVFLCDSYQQSIPYNESKEWLMDLIAVIHRGLFIITGREKLRWDDPQKDILPYHLQSFPEDVARAHLKKYIPGASKETVNEILLSSQCVPLFVDMAIDVYRHEENTSKLANLTYFKNRDQLTQRFIYHLPEKWHSILLALSVVGIFNRDIFLYLGKELACSCPMEDYEEIVSTDLSNYIEQTQGLVKLHDVFCYHATQFLTDSYKRDVWHYYLKFIHARGAGSLEGNIQGALLTLFLNLLQRCSELKLRITVQESEWLIDIFFQIMDTRTFFEPPSPGSGGTEELNDLYLMMNAVIYEKVNTNETIGLLSRVKHPAKFGKHEKSYSILLGYSQSLLGCYSDFHAALEKMDQNLNHSDRAYWYYPRIKMYLADYLLMVGRFRTALQSLLDMQNDELSDDMCFQSSRAIGHIYRFNMVLELAERTYQIERAKFLASINSRVYLQTNLCETYCFFNLEQFDLLYESTLEDALKLGNLKNLGKLYYSKAIVLACKGQLNQAYTEVQRSLGVNRRDGYQSGELFAYMARAYCDYAKYGAVQAVTRGKIEQLLAQNGVYQFFRLPLFMMSGEQRAMEDLREKYEWLNFDQTVSQYAQFLKRLRPNEPSE